MGAGRVYYICETIINAVNNQNTHKIKYSYPFLVETVIELKRYSRRYLNESKGKYISQR